MEVNADLTREIISNAEKTMEELQLPSERKSDDSCAEFYDLTVESPSTPTNYLHHRKRDKTHRSEGRRRSKRDRSSSRKSKRRGKGTRGKSQNLISTVRTWTKYDERIESFARYSTHSDSITEDDTSESSKIARSRTRREIDPPIRCYDRTAERSKSRSRSRSRYTYRRSTERQRRNYSSDKGDEDRERFKRRAHKKRRSNIHSPSKRRGSSPDIYRRRYSNGSDEKGTQRSKRRSRSRSRRYGKFRRSSHESERSESNVKVEFNPQSDADYGVFSKLKSTVKSTIAKSTNSPSQSEVWQDFFDISTDPSPNPNAEKEYQDQNKVSMATNDAQEQNDSNISPVDGDRNPIKFNFTKSLKVDKLNVNDAFDGVTNQSFTELKCKLSTLLKTVLDEPGTEDIDTEIIQKLTAQPISDTSTDRLAKNLQFDFESVKQAVTTAQMLESKHCSANDSQRNNSQVVGTHRSQLHEISQKDFPLYRPYCPVPVPQFESPTSPVSTSTPKPSLLSLLKLPIPSTKFLPRLPRVPFQTPSRPQYGHPSKSSHAEPQTNSILNQRSSVCIERKRVPMTYGDHKRIKASKGLDLNFEWKNFKIPKKSIGQPTLQSSDKPRSPASVTLIDDSDDDGKKYDIRQPTSSQSADKTKSRTRVTLVDNNDASENYDFGEPTNIVNNRLDQHIDSHTTDNLSDPVDNSSKEENMASTIKELMGTDQFATLVDIMKKITQDDTLTKLQTALTNCTSGIDKNVEDGHESSLSTGEPRKNCKIRKQKKPTTSNPTSDGQEGTLSTEKSTFKNNQLEWHSLRKVLTCQECHRPHGNSMVSHYVNEHPDSEVLISRLAPEAAECLRSRKVTTECKVVRQPGSPNNEFHQYCYFCNIFKCLTKKQWIVHMARHTGYYTVKCNHCSRMFAQKPTGLKCSTINDFKKISQPQFQKKELKAYVCDLCNYVRCHKTEIEMHLSNAHEENASKKFTDFTFLTFPYPKRGPYKKRKNRSESLDDFITMLETECETDWNSDAESDDETDWNSDDESDCETDEVEDELNELMELSEPNEPQSDDEDDDEDTVKSEMESIHFDCDAPDPEADNEGNDDWEVVQSNGGIDSD